MVALINFFFKWEGVISGPPDVDSLRYIGIETHHLNATTWIIIIRSNTTPSLREDEYKLYYQLQMPCGLRSYRDITVCSRVLFLRILADDYSGLDVCALSQTCAIRT